jgi:hypothetical protein
MKIFKCQKAKTLHEDVTFKKTDIENFEINLLGSSNSQNDV